jgi:hypothetical protein
MINAWEIFVSQAFFLYFIIFNEINLKIYDDNIVTNKSVLVYNGMVHCNTGCIAHC